MIWWDARGLADVVVDRLRQREEQSSVDAVIRYERANGAIDDDVEIVEVGMERRGEARGFGHVRQLSQHAAEHQHQGVDEQSVDPVLVVEEVLLAAQELPQLDELRGTEVCACPLDRRRYEDMMLLHQEFDNGLGQRARDRLRQPCFEVVVHAA